MRAFRIALEASRTVLAGVSCLYFLRAQFKQVKTRNYNGRLVWLLAAMLLASGGEAIVTMIQPGGIPDILAATLLYILALLLHINHLWPGMTEEKQPAWHAHIGFLTIMAVVDMPWRSQCVNNILGGQRSQTSRVSRAKRECHGLPGFSV